MTKGGLRERAERLSRHSAYCAWKDSRYQREALGCTCGLDKLLADLQALDERLTVTHEDLPLFGVARGAGRRGSAVPAKEYDG